MKKSNVLYVLALVAVVLSVLVSQSCKQSSGKRNETVSVDPAFREFIEGFTSGPISTESGIVVKLNFDYADSITTYGFPKQYEWVAALGFMVTLVWIYVQVLRLIVLLASRRD